ncbi:hypothetical protein Hdeb2414_s0021g00576861 [Helianthus debilis subsp. tardiflorus]
MSIGDHHQDSAEEMVVELPPLKWSRETFDGFIQNIKFPESWGAWYPDDGYTTANAPAGYITLFWDFFSTVNFRLPATKFFLEILSYYKFHISQMHLLGWLGFDTLNLFVVRCILNRLLPFPGVSSDALYLGVLFVCATGICKEDFAAASEIMVFRGKEEVPTETIYTPSEENWYQDLKNVPSIALPEKAFVGASMSLNWRMNREEKPVYMEDGKVTSLYVVAFKRECGKMSTVPKKI